MIGGNEFVVSDQVQGGAHDAPLLGGEIAAGEHVDALVLRSVLDAASLRRRRLTTSRAVLVVGRERFLAVSAGVTLARERVAALVDDAGLLEDGVVVLLAGDVLVRRPHVGIDLPHDPVLDLRARVALATHPRDGGVPKVVRVDRLLDAGLLGRPADLRADRRRGEHSISLSDVVAVAWQLVEEGRLVDVWPGVHSRKIGSQDGLRVDEGVLRDGRTLQASGIRIRPKGRPLALEVEVLDAQRHHERESDASVREELDHGDVAEVVRGTRQGADVLGGEHVVRRNGVVGRRDQVVVVDPLEVATVDVNRLQKAPDDELRIPDCGRAEPGFGTATVLFGVLEIVDEGVEILLGQRVKWLLEASRGDAEVLQILRERALLDALVPLLDRLFHVGPVGFGILVEFLELALELLLIPLGVVEGRHAHIKRGVSYETEAWKNRLFGFLSTGIPAGTEAVTEEFTQCFESHSPNSFGGVTGHATGESHPAIASPGGVPA